MKPGSKVKQPVSLLQLADVDRRVAERAGDDRERGALAAAESVSWTVLSDTARTPAASVAARSAPRAARLIAMAPRRVAGNAQLLHVAAARRMHAAHGRSFRPATIAAQSRRKAGRARTGTPAPARAGQSARSELRQRMLHTGSASVGPPSANDCAVRGVICLTSRSGGGTCRRDRRCRRPSACR